MNGSKFDWKAAAIEQATTMLGGRIEFPVDRRLAFLLDNFPCKDMRAVEFGCWHGWHTAALAKKFQKVTAIDVRPDNISKTLLRLNMLGINNVDVKLADVNEFEFETDVLVHVGVLYHLFSPVAHLNKVLPHCKVLCLDTHINRPGLKSAVEVYDGVTYRGGIYNEHGWKDPLSGTEVTSLWLEEEDLRKVLDLNGFGIINEFHHEVQTGKRLSVVAVQTFLM